MICNDLKNFGKKNGCKNCPAFFSESVNKDTQQKEALDKLYANAKDKITKFVVKFKESPNVFYLGVNEIKELNELRGSARSFYGRHIIPVKKNNWFEAGYADMDQDITEYVDPSFYLFTWSPN